jgi:exopolysaccharide biosynthesis polyprenyl glycosylphosphotransferase
VIVAVVFWLWLPLTQWRWNLWPLDLSQYTTCAGVLVIGLVLAYATDSKKNWFAQRSFFTCHTLALRQTIFAAGLLSLLLVGEQDRTISRFFLFTFVPVLYGILFATLRLLPPLLRNVNQGSLRKHRLLVAGCARNVSKLESWLDRKELAGYNVVGLVSHDDKIEKFGGHPVLGMMEDLERIIVERDITHVVLAEFLIFRHLVIHYADVCERNGVRLLVMCDFESTLRHPVTMFEDEGIRFIGLREEPLEDPFGSFAKRCLDIVVALPVVLFILPPLTLLVFCLQQRYSPGPIFYRQLRSGFQNIPFVIFKFRTMHFANLDPAKQAFKGDSRIYPGGQWLRKLSIDELPQFLNVLLGDMSVVGPRPHLMQHDDVFARALANYPVRRNVKPGITGLAQVRGFRGEIKKEADVINRVESDIHYLENWSFFLDCWIIFRTALQFFSPPRTAV